MPAHSYYAMYRGDTYIDQGDTDYFVSKYGMSKKKVYWLASKPLHRRDKGNMLLLYRLED